MAVPSLGDKSNVTSSSAVLTPSGYTAPCTVADSVHLVYNITIDYGMFYMKFSMTVGYVDLGYLKFGVTVD